MRDRYWRSCFLILLIGLLAGCLPAGTTQASPPWVYSDLRLLASPGEGHPTHQLVGLYTRSIPAGEQVRLDLLDFEAVPDFDLYLALDTSPGGVQDLPINIQANLDWDILICIPASGSLQALTPKMTPLDGITLRVLRNPSLDTVVVTFSSKQLSSPYSIQVFLTPPASREVVSFMVPVRSDAWSPPRLPVLLAFWNTFPAYTPAQAMRRYDGAHTGPASDRHGLRGLLDAIEASSFPAALLDIKNPLFLSALDFAGALPRLQSLDARELLILPDQQPLAAPSDDLYQPSLWSRIQAAQHARQVALDFGLSPSPFIYFSTFPSGLSVDLLQQAGAYRLVFSTGDPLEEQPVPIASPGVSVNDTETLPAGSLSPQISRWGAYSWVNIVPAAAGLYSSTQATTTGPALEIRRSLLDAVTSPYADQMILLGGELAQTSWGNPQAAMQTLQYLKSRPWIQPVTQSYLNSLSVREPSHPAPSSISSGETEQPLILFNPQGEPLSSGLSAQQMHDQLIHELRSAPQNEATHLAWQAYEALLAPPPFATPHLAPLRAAYLGQIGHLLAAARWGETGPSAFCEPAGASTSCQAALDLDWDGEDEYLLLSPSTFALFEARGGYLGLAFVRDAGNLHQVVGPSTQFLVGMGDPLSWKPELGVAGDSAQLRGAFSDLPAGYASPVWEQFSVTSSGETLSFSSPNGSLRKSFRLNEFGLEVNYASSYPLTVQIPLALDPSARFFPGWGSRYQAFILPNGWSFILQDSLQVQILTTELLSVKSFKDAFEYMGQPEDPDFDYPPGIHLPFPIELVEVQAEGEFSIQLQVQLASP